MRSNQHITVLVEWYYDLRSNWKRMDLWKICWSVSWRLLKWWVICKGKFSDHLHNLNFGLKSFFLSQKALVQPLRSPRSPLTWSWKSATYSCIRITPSLGTLNRFSTDGRRVRNDVLVDFCDLVDQPAPMPLVATRMCTLRNSSVSAQSAEQGKRCYLSLRIVIRNACRYRPHSSLDRRCNYIRHFFCLYGHKYF
jgi:hypothetical protein